MLLDWRHLLRQIGKRGAEMAQLSPGTRRGYQMLHEAGVQTARLDAKTRELICLAVAVTTRCDGCIVSHVQKAIQLGTTREELAEALGVAVAMNAGAAIAYSGRALDAYAALTEKSE